LTSDVVDRSELTCFRAKSPNGIQRASTSGAATVSLDELANFLGSDRAPAGCMDLSELDGFLAGLLAAPVPVPLAEWLEEVWDHEEPAYADAAEEATVRQAIIAHFAAIEAALDASPLEYAPILWQDGAGNTVAEDWAAGFMQAVSLRSEAWQPALSDEDASLLLIPIASLAETAVLEAERGEPALTDDALDGLVQDAEQVLPVCISGLRRFWRDQRPTAGLVRH
jgi:uncharacterized protein